jgi:hypothetical protein
MLLGIFSALFLAPAIARHDDTVSASKITVRGREVTWEVDVSRSMLEGIVRFPAEPLDLLESDLPPVKGAIADYLRKGLSLRANGRELAPEVGALRAEQLPFVTTGELYIARFHLDFVFRAPEDLGELTLGLRFFEDRMKYHRAVVTVEWDGHVREFTKMGPGEVSIAYDRLVPTFWGTARFFFLGGLRRFLGAYETIAFLLALLVLARVPAERSRIAASAAMGVLLAYAFAANFPMRLSRGLVGALAAASSVYVAAENFWVTDGRFRWGIAFGLGLLHGLEFGGSYLRRGVDEGGSGWGPVIWYAVGLLGGLLSVLLVFWPVWALLGQGRAGGESPAVRPGAVRAVSAGALVLGASALLERLTGTALLSRWWHES